MTKAAVILLALIALAMPQPPAAQEKVWLEPDTSLSPPEADDDSTQQAAREKDESEEKAPPPLEISLQDVRDARTLRADLREMLDRLRWAIEAFEGAEDSEDFRMRTARRRQLAEAEKSVLGKWGFARIDFQQLRHRMGPDHELIEGNGELLDELHETITRARTLLNRGG